jgi:four helix bundle protein
MDASARKGVERFEDLRVWETARELARGVYRAAKVQPLGDDYAMLNQMKRAALSISSNIAEGYERGTRKQQIEFCYMAKGSAGELRSQVLLAHDTGLLDDTAFTWLHGRCELCSRQLAACIRHLKQTRTRIQGAKFVEDERGTAATGPEMEGSKAEAEMTAPPCASEGTAPLPTSPHPHLPTTQASRGHHGTV